MFYFSRENYYMYLYGKFHKEHGLEPYSLIDYMIVNKDKPCKNIIWNMKDLFEINFKYAQRPDCSNPKETLYRMISQIVYVNVELRYAHTIAVNQDPNPNTNYENIWKNPDLNYKLNIPINIRKRPGTLVQKPLDRKTLVQEYSRDYEYAPNNRTSTQFVVARYKKDFKFCDINLYNLLDRSKGPFQQELIDRLQKEEFMKLKNKWLDDAFGSIPTSLDPLRYMNTDKMFLFAIAFYQYEEGDDVTLYCILTPLYFKRINPIAV